MAGETPRKAGVVALVGHPNVGKSTLFEALTGHRVIAANYPGTTVEIVRAAGRRLDATFIDSPGILSFPSRTEDEQATVRVLLDSSPVGVLQVGDAKNLRRTLLVTVQLAEMGLPLTLALNMADEAGERGMPDRAEELSRLLSIPVVATTAVRGEGIRTLEEALRAPGTPSIRVGYPAPIEAAVRQLAEILPDDSLSERSVGLLFLAGDPVAEEWVRDHLDDRRVGEMVRLRTKAAEELGSPLSSAILAARIAVVDTLLGDGIGTAPIGGQVRKRRISRLTTHPVWGIPLLAAVLSGLYWFVGVFGAGTLVGWLEGTLFGEYINPWLSARLDRLVAWDWLRDLLVGEYGLWTMGMTYALALILPIVATFFFAFGLLEDSGYLPRLAVLTNRIFKAMGLNGTAVVPMVLGLGCVTMATMTTRILSSKRDRLLVILLLSLGVPCSAQLGVVMGMLGGISMTALMIWGFVVAGVLVTVGWLAARLVPGDRSVFVAELPPMRRPPVRPVVLKTVARVEWYLREVVPLFLLGSVLLFVLDRLDVLQWLVGVAEPLVVDWLELPAEAATAFMMGFFRRDFGATGLFLIAGAGLLTPLQIVVSMTTITLFVPCVASVLMIAKERGAKTAAAVTALVFPLAILIGGLLSRTLEFVGWGA
ncbi:MAG: ferrous iron transport protein B [Acidimicrobiia bacterium]|nr:ferrous iron transport protein B [Acidimicrobiia bacterium]